MTGFSSRLFMDNCCRMPRYVCAANACINGALRPALTGASPSTLSKNGDRKFWSAQCRGDVRCDEGILRSEVRKLCNMTKRASAKGLGKHARFRVSREAARRPVRGIGCIPLRVTAVTFADPQIVPGITILRVNAALSCAVTT
jgi:hypothetical protein